MAGRTCLEGISPLGAEIEMRSLMALMAPLIQLNSNSLSSFLVSPRQGHCGLANCNSHIIKGNSINGGESS